MGIPPRGSPFCHSDSLPGSPPLPSSHPSEAPTIRLENGISVVSPGTPQILNVNHQAESWQGENLWGRERRLQLLTLPALTWRPDYSSLQYAATPNCLSWCSHPCIVSTPSLFPQLPVHSKSKDKGPLLSEPPRSVEESCYFMNTEQAQGKPQWFSAEAM